MIDILNIRFLSALPSFLTDGGFSSPKSRKHFKVKNIIADGKAFRIKGKFLFCGDAASCLSSPYYCAKYKK